MPGVITLCTGVVIAGAPLLHIYVAPGVVLATPIDELEPMAQVSGAGLPLANCGGVRS